MATSTGNTYSNGSDSGSHVLKLDEGFVNVGFLVSIILSKLIM